MRVRRSRSRSARSSGNEPKCREMALLRAHAGPPLPLLARAYHRVEPGPGGGALATSAGFDRGQRAYVFTNTGTPDRGFRLRLPADAGHLLHNPAFVVKNAGASEVRVKINGEQLKPGTGYRAGFRHHPGCSDLILWINKQTSEPVELEILPAKR